jgi:PHP family Zn ribbon phosphoesterase
MQYKGNRWFKCDFHLHTTASKCFQDDTVTAEQWVKKAIDAGLDCVAVTDHNTGAGITAIQEAAKDTNLIVFPGVEITCDTSKIHLLVLFDVNKSSQDIEDFLIKCDIARDKFGEQDAYTNKSIFEVIDIAENSLVIPAHIDEYNGLEKVSYDNLKTLYVNNNVNAVHVVHKEFLDSQTNTDELKLALNNYYNNPSPSIDDATIKSWRTPIVLAAVPALIFLQ